MRPEINVALKDRMRFLTTADEVDQFIQDHALALIFKAGECPTTSETFASVLPILEAREEVPFALIRVVDARPASNHLAERTGVRHESPQLLVFRDGRLVSTQNHWKITGNALVASLADAGRGVAHTTRG